MNGAVTAGTNTDNRLAWIFNIRYLISLNTKSKLTTLRFGDDSLLYKQLLLNRKPLCPFQVPADPCLLFPMQLAPFWEGPPVVFRPQAPLAEQLDPHR